MMVVMSMSVSLLHLGMRRVIMVEGGKFILIGVKIHFNLSKSQIFIHILPTTDNSNL